MQALKNALLPFRAGVGSIITPRSLFNSPKFAIAPAINMTTTNPNGFGIFRNFSQLCSSPSPSPNIASISKSKLKESLPLGLLQLQPPISPFQISTRNITRCYFPRPSETKRIRKHGWKKRMQTKDGRRILMRRILKGVYILSH